MSEHRRIQRRYRQVNSFYYFMKFAFLLLFCTGILHPDSVLAVEQQKHSDPYEWLLSGSVVSDTVITSGDEHVRITYRDGSYLLLQPNSSISLSVMEPDAVEPGMRVELLFGELFINAIENPAGSLNLLVNENLVTLYAANAGINRMGFFWVEAGRIQITSLMSGNQVSIHKGMYAQSSSAGEIVSGNLSSSEIQQLSNLYGFGSGSGNSIEYTVGFDEAGVIQLREINSQTLNN